LYHLFKDLHQIYSDKTIITQ